MVELRCSKVKGELYTHVKSNST